MDRGYGGEEDYDYESASDNDIDIMAQSDPESKVKEIQNFLKHSSFLSFNLKPN